MDKEKGKHISVVKTETASSFIAALNPDLEYFERGSRVFYRGQADSLWKLQPSAHRVNSLQYSYGKSGNELIADFHARGEIRRLERFVIGCDKAGLPLLNDSIQHRSKSLEWWGSHDVITRKIKYPKEDLFEYLAIAQHNGLPTRLLDWSLAPFPAAYFAASGALRNVVYSAKKSLNEDGKAALATIKEKNLQTEFCVYLLNTGVNFGDEPPFWSNNALKQQLRIVRSPSGFNRYVAAQSGVFTLHCQSIIEEDKPLVDISHCEFLQSINQADCLKKIVAPVSIAMDVLNLLEKYGVCGATIYPSYHGATEYALDQSLCSDYEHIFTLT